MPSGNDFFYSRLPVNEIPLGDLLLEEHLFHQVPSDWFIIITDIKDSTAEIAQGRHETVNLVATGSIVAVLNIAYKVNLTLPYFFGGDGASFIIPASILPQVVHALQQYHQQTLENFKMDLRVGVVPVSDLYAHNEQLSVGKFKTTKLFTIPIVLGNGLIYAEKTVKAPGYALPVIEGKIAELDLQGMQCRWDLIKPPIETDEVVSLIVVATGTVKQSETYKRVIDLLDRIYGEARNRQPIAANRMRLNATLGRIAIEMKARMGRMNFLYGLRTWLTGTFGFIYFRTKFGKEYLERLIAMSDTLVVDGRINTVISGNATQRQKLQQELDELEKSGLVRYGLSTSNESVMSCYVRNLNDDHVHFVDGAEGGYTRAAMMLKKKFPRLSHSDNNLII